jgi:hypothetical protein
MNGKDVFVGMGVDRMTILKLILEEYDLMEYIRFINVRGWDECWPLESTAVKS